jgi:peptidoglycan/xylan/chitin deacetylase (PgdA/CDA1 family)
MAAEPLVLMYHSVEPYSADPFRITVSPDRFDRQMRWLRRNGLRGASMGEVLRRRPRDRLVGLTFDDGYRDFISHALPVLDRHGFTATVFVIAGALGGHNHWDSPGPRKALMTADEVRLVAAAGIEIGSHSLTHRLLTETGAGDLADEVGRSRGILRELTGRDVTGFCYPYGGAGDREVAAARAAGYDYACAVRPSTSSCRHALPRTYVGDRDTPARLYAKWARHRVRSLR